MSHAPRHLPLALIAMSGFAIGSLVLVAAALPGGEGGIPSDHHYPSLNLIESTMLTTASSDFADHDAAFVAAHLWERERAQEIGKPAPYLVCSEYGQAREARGHLERLSPSASSIYAVSHTKEHGACFVATVSTAEAESLMDDPESSSLTTAGPFLSTLKLAPGLLDHGKPGAVDALNSSSPLSTTYGEKIDNPGTTGLSIRLSPGTMKKRDAIAKAVVQDWRSDLMSPRSLMDIQASNLWSDPRMLEGDEGHLSRPAGRLLAQEWTRAAEVVAAEAMEVKDNSIGEACGWNGVQLHPAEDDVIFLTGIDHLLPSNEDTEARRACFMYLLSHLASKPEVLRVSHLSENRLLNGVASAIVQSANIMDTPLLDAGLDGTGEVIQVVDSGLDETSCFFIDENGMEIEHGSYYLGYYLDQNGVVYRVLAPEDSYYHDSSRRKVVQYIELFKITDPSVDRVDGDGFYYYSEVYGPPADSMGFDQDGEEGHGTHTAGTAAGSRLPTFSWPPCPEGETYGCAGKCVPEGFDDAAGTNSFLDIEAYCPAFDCDGGGDTSPNCLTNYLATNMDRNGGVAPGAKLAIFDILHQTKVLGTSSGNGPWEASMGTGAKVHSNSWGSTENLCEVSDADVMYDEFVYENQEHLILFSAGNFGGYKDFPEYTSCTIGSPALGKNTLTVGATSSGPTRVPTTGEDGRLRYDQVEGIGVYDPVTGEPYTSDPRFHRFGLPSSSAKGADIDTVAIFSSYGPTADKRIKPEVVAPGDQVFSASSDGTDSGSCMLRATQGTSMACPVVAGSAALVRQYFKDETFYATDVTLRGFCGITSSFLCKPFAPSAATVKAMLINSANLMGGSAMPDEYRGFGRVHLEAGMPIGGEGNVALFVADSSTTAVGENGKDEYSFDVDGAAGEEFRATLSWIDPPSQGLSSKLLLHDLDLIVTSPDGTEYYMWGTKPSEVDVNERVIVPASDVVSGVWCVHVTAGALLTTWPYQSYSLVVTGAFTTK